MVRSYRFLFMPNNCRQVNNTRLWNVTLGNPLKKEENSGGQVVLDQASLQKQRWGLETWNPLKLIHAVFCLRL